MVSWAYARGLQLFLIEPGKPNQNADTESLNEQLRKNFERALVHQSGARMGDHRSLASVRQREAPQEGTWQIAPLRPMPSD